jgi:quercetin dioxygenase-like cupin family protein
MEAKQTLTTASVPKGEGEARWWFGMLTEIKATAADTGGQFSLVQVTCPPGYQAVRHVHHREDEGFWIVDGDVTLEVGGTLIEAHAGDYAFGPRDIPHSFSVGNSGCRMLFLLTPGGFEELIRATSEPARGRVVPPPATEPPDIARMNQIVARYGAEIVSG